MGAACCASGKDEVVETTAAQIDVQPEVQKTLDYATETNPEFAPEAKIEAQPDPLLGTKLAVEPEATPEAKPEAEPEARPEAPQEQLGKPGAEAGVKREEIPTHPDFTGLWLCTKVEGDADKFLTDLGVGWAIRKAAKAMGMGVNKTWHDIKMSGDEVVVDITNAQGKKMQQKFRVGGGEQTTVGGTGEPLVLTPAWSKDGQAIEANAKSPDGKPKPAMKRFYKGNEMVIDMISPQGTVYTYIFTKQ